MPHSHQLPLRLGFKALTTLPRPLKLYQSSHNQLDQVHDLRAPCSSQNGPRYHVQNHHTETSQHYSLHQDVVRHSDHLNFLKVRLGHLALHQALLPKRCLPEERHLNHHHDPIQETIRDLDSSMKAQRLHRRQGEIWQEVAMAPRQAQESVLDPCLPL
jgi:hypothetical protein